jgi:hypothetical protein
METQPAPMPAKAPAPQEDSSHVDDESRRASEGRRKRSHQEADLPVVDDDDDGVWAAWPRAMRIMDKRFCRLLFLSNQTR